MRRILITSALPYINGIKHLGNLAGSMLPADVFARFHRSLGDEVLFICATDEHGTPAELAAAAKAQDVRTYCDEQHEEQRAISLAFGLSFDSFGRSSSSQNQALTQHFAKVLEDNGFIEERWDEMIYSKEDGRFLPDRYVEGTCPICQFDKARGDQCDNCGSLLDPIQLINPYSVISGSRALEIRKTAHLYLLQSKLQDEIRAFVDSHADWPILTRSIAYKFLDEGLIDRGITRDLSWGVPVAFAGVPRPGFEHKVFYVWFDAPIAYIAATREWAEDPRQQLSHEDQQILWKKWWRTDQGALDVHYIQVMGKDNVAFHTVSFPATIIGSREPWKKVDMLKSFNWLNWYGGKFSTSQQRGVFMDQALALLPPDYWRWYLTSQAPESGDTVFTWEQFQAVVNKDLSDVLGNFANRVLKFTQSKFAGISPSGGRAGEAEIRLRLRLKDHLSLLTKNLEALELRKSAQILRQIWVIGNEYLQETAPWTVFKQDPAHAGVILRMALALIGLYARLSLPFIPFSAKVLADCVGEGERLEVWPKAEDIDVILENGLAEGLQIQVPDVLFPKVDDAKIADWKIRFGGED